MNERTEQLYKEAVALASSELHKWNKNWRWGNHTNFEYEKVLYKKFAELILQDVLTIVDGKELLPYFDAHVESEPEDPIGKGWWRKQETIKRVIKQHFGVEQ